MLILLPIEAWATIATQPNVFVPYTPIKASQMNADFQALVTLLNGNVDGIYNIGAGAIATGNLATNSVTSAKIFPGAVGTTQLANQSVTKANEAPNGMVSSGTSAAYGTASSNDSSVFADTPFTSFGNPVMVMLIGFGTSGTGAVVAVAGATQNTGVITFWRDDATTNIEAVSTQISAQPGIGGAQSAVSLPCSAFSFIDTPAAGTHTYNLRAHVTGTNTNSLLTVPACQLVIYEL